MSNTITPLTALTTRQKAFVDPAGALLRGSDRWRLHAQGHVILSRCTRPISDEAVLRAIQLVSGITPASGALDA